MISFADDCVPCILILVTYDQEAKQTKARALKIKPEYMVPFERELSVKMKEVICDSFDKQRVQYPKRFYENYKVNIEDQNKVKTESLKPYQEGEDKEKFLKARLTARPEAFTVKRKG